MHLAWLDITSLQGQKDKDRTNAMTLVTSTRDCTLIQSPIRSKETATLCDLRLRYPKPKPIDVVKACGTKLPCHVVRISRAITNTGQR